MNSDRTIVPPRVELVKQKDTPPLEVRRYLREIAACAREAAESDDERVVRLGCQVLAAQAARLSVLTGVGR